MVDEGGSIRLASLLNSKRSGACAARDSASARTMDAAAVAAMAPGLAMSNLAAANGSGSRLGRAWTWRVRVLSQSVGCSVDEVEDGDGVASSSGVPGDELSRECLSMASASSLVVGEESSLVVGDLALGRGARLIEASISAL